jgi:signal transduction histidine kinase
MSVPPHARPTPARAEDPDGTAAPRSSRPTARALAAWLPRGDVLPTADWQWRHKAVCLVLAVHLPVLLLIALLGDGPGAALLVLAPAGLLVLACSKADRRLRGLGASLGLLTSSGLLVHLLDHVPEAHFHHFVVIAVVALYQDWSFFVLAVVFVLAEQVVLADGSTVPASMSTSWSTALVHVAAVLAESLVLVLFWRANEISHVKEEQLRAELSVGRSSVQARIEETERIRADLIGTVSHEFRTPLTGIRGAALTLLKKGDRLDPTSRAGLLHAVLDQQERLSRLLENMLLAARATEVDPTAVTDVNAVAAEVAMLASAGRPGAARVSVVVEAGTAARIDRQALHQVLANLVDNAVQHGAPGAVPLVAAGRDDRGVWLTVSNEGRVLDLTEAERLFEPFTQQDSGATRDREGIGVGLYVVRRLVDVYGGSLDVRSEAGWVTVEVRLHEATAKGRPALLDLPA